MKPRIIPMSAGILAVGTADGHLTQDRGEGASY